MTMPWVCWKRALTIAGLFAVPAAAELQNVEVGGKIEIYGAWFSDFFEVDGATRIPDLFLFGRPIGPGGTFSGIRAGDGGNNLGFLEQRARLHVSADFTDHVKAFVEFDTSDTWGTDFQSNYITGVDFRHDTTNGIEVHQGYIEASEIFGSPITARIGRQELEFGSGWMVGADPGPDPFAGLSFDAIRLTYETEAFTIDAWWSKLSENGAAEEDGDIDFYGIYGTFRESGLMSGKDPMVLQPAVMPIRFFYQGLTRLGPFRGRSAPTDELVEFNVYWMFVRDGVNRESTSFIRPVERIEDLLGLDDYQGTRLHTAGTRGAGSYSGFDWEVEAAYQWGEADSVGSLFAAVGRLYSDTDAKFGNWGGHAEVGYTLDTEWAPRIFLGGSYYGGEDNRDISFGEWLQGFFATPDASISFNRMFSSWREDAFLDGGSMSNFWKAYLGVTVAPTEKIEIGATVTYLEAIDEFDSPPSIKIGGGYLPLTSVFSFLTRPGSKDLGTQASIWVAYQYAEDLTIEAGWSHYFTGEAISDGIFVLDNGMTFFGGRGHDDADYFYFYTSLEF